jgi:hypothetical protein
MAATLWLFTFLKARPRLAEQIRVTVPGSWVVIPMFIMFGFIGGAGIAIVNYFW